VGTSERPQRIIRRACAPGRGSPVRGRRGAAFEQHGAEGAAPLLFGVVDELAALDGQRPAAGGAEQEEEEGGIGPVPFILLGLALVGGAAAAIVVARRRRHALVRRASPQ